MSALRASIVLLGDCYPRPDGRGYYMSAFWALWCARIYPQITHYKIGEAGRNTHGDPKAVMQ
jgi:hypothetical protein